MAPLLGRKPFPLVKPLPGEEPLFTIAHTQEAFRTREYPFQPGRQAARGVGRSGPGARRGRRAAQPAPVAAVSAPNAGGPACRAGARARRSAGWGRGPARSPAPSILSPAPHFVPGPRFRGAAPCPRVALGPKYERERAFPLLLFLSF